MLGRDVKVRGEGTGCTPGRRRCSNSPLPWVCCAYQLHPKGRIGFASTGSVDRLRVIGVLSEESLKVRAVQEDPPADLKGHFQKRDRDLSREEAEGLSLGEVAHLATPTRIMRL